jgi:hypothetical protein
MLDRDIWLTANLIIKQHGDDAEIQAAMRVDDMSSRGDFLGRAVWRRILKAVRELKVPAPTGSLH